MGKTFFEMCRYYKGEAENPHEGDAAMFWEYEKWWVDSFDDKQKHDVLLDAISRYVKLGLMPFRENDGTPMTLKALLLNRYEEWCEGSPGDFERWYSERYLKGSK